MVQALVQSLVLVAVAVETVPAIISNLAQVNLALAIPVHLATHVLLLVPIVLLIHALRVLLIHVQHHALVTHVHPPVHVLLNPKLAVNVEALAATKHGSPSSPPFCMESSRFR
jgi:uncharacterized membrane protein